MAQAILFGEFELLTQERRLLRAGKALTVGARAFDVLVLLAGRAGNLVTKADILEHVWPNAIVEENNLQVHVSSLRRLLGTQAIATVSGQGYRFTLPIRHQGPAPSLPPAVVPTALKRSVAVLPFANLSGDRDQDYFADGVAEDVIAHLTRSSWLFVAARNSTFLYRGEAITAERVSRELGVRYVVFGSVRLAGGALRLTAELVDASSGESLWSKRYDRSAADLFAVQDELSSAIVGAIEPVYLHHEQALARAQAGETLEHWQHLMRARWHFWRSTRDHLDKCSQQVQAALALKDEDSACFALQAFVHLTRVWAGWAPDVRGELAEAHRLALRAVRNDETDANAHFTLGTVLSCTNQHDMAIAELETALRLYPQCAAAAGELGRLHAFAGQVDEAHEYALQAIDASPHDPHVSLWLRTRAVAEFVAGNYAQAVRHATQAAAKRPDWFFNQFILAASLQLDGQAEAAAQALARGLEFGPYPMQTLRVGHPFTQPDTLQRFVGALTQAGWKG